MQIGLAAAAAVAAGYYFMNHQQNKNAVDKASDRFEQVCAPSLPPSERVHVCRGVPNNVQMRTTRGHALATASPPFAHAG